MNVLSKDKQAAIIVLFEQGVSQREISSKTGIDRKTIRRYARRHLARIGSETGSNSPSPGDMATGVVSVGNKNPPPWPPVETQVSATIPKHARSACAEYREWIEAQVQLGRNAMAIYQDLVETHGFTSRYNSVKRFVRGLRRTDPKQYDHLEFLPGEEVQVDYGLGAPTLHSSGKYRRPRLFVMTLRFSRRSFRKVVWQSSQETWARLHEEAFRYFAGSVQYVVLDNLKEGVITPDIYEPGLNPVYAAMLTHYSVVADPARVKDPDRKGSVENAIQHTQDTALKGRKFESIEAQNEWLMHWEERWASRRIHGRAKRQVEEMYQEEKPYLKPLPLMPFSYFRQVTRTVWDDGAVQVDNSYYSAVPAPLYSEVIVRIYADEIEVINPRTMELIRRHSRSSRPGSFIMNPEDRIFNPSRQTEYLMKKAESIGPWTARLCRVWFTEEGRPGQRRIQGVVNLIRRHETARIERAARVAVEAGLHSYKAFQRLVESAGEWKTAAVSEDVTQDHCLIRSGKEYQAFWDHHAVQASVQPVNPDRCVEASPRFPVSRQDLPAVWSNASWRKVIETFGLEVDAGRRHLPDEFWVKSPFTCEKTASLHMNSAQNIYKDFSSGRGGGILTFCQELLQQQGRRMNCYDVARWMLEVGISRIDEPRDRKVQPSMNPDRSGAAPNRPITVDLRRFLRPDHPEWIRRHISEKTCAYLGCGFLPLRPNGFPQSPLNGRLVFQIRGIEESVSRLEPVILSHVGRALTEDQGTNNGKYWSYPFRKGLEIYNQDKLLLDREAQDQVNRYGLILVEGFFDVAALVEAGCLNVGGLMGSHITPSQINRLKFLASRMHIPSVTVFLDRDFAGENGAVRATALLNENGIPAKRFDWNQATITCPSIPIGANDPADLSPETLNQLRKQEII